MTNSYPELPPIQLVDGAFLSDNSSRESLICPQLYRLKHIHKRESLDKKAGRNFGACLHEGWKARYRTCGSRAVTDSSVETINKAMSDFFESNPQPENDFRTLEHAQRVMTAYNTRYKNETFTILRNAKGESAVESSFIFPEPLGYVSGVGGRFVDQNGNPITVNKVPVYPIGRIDMFVSDHEGEWVWDHKTAFQYGKGWTDKMATNDGQIGYVWAFKQFYGHYPRGYVIDGVRIRRPSKAEEYSGLAPIDNTDFVRIPHIVFEEQVEEWKINTLAMVQSILDYHRRDYYPLHRRCCVTEYGRCDMYEVCVLPRQSRADALNGNNFQPSIWSPLNKTED